MMRQVKRPIHLLIAQRCLASASKPQMVQRCTLTFTAEAKEMMEAAIKAFFATAAREAENA